MFSYLEMIRKDEDLSDLDRQKVASDSTLHLCAKARDQLLPDNIFLHFLAGVLVAAERLVRALLHLAPHNAHRLLKSK